MLRRFHFIPCFYSFPGRLVVAATAIRPESIQAGDKDNVFRGGFRTWKKSAAGRTAELNRRDQGCEFCVHAGSKWKFDAVVKQFADYPPIELTIGWRRGGAFAHSSLIRHLERLL